jgi:hypothetical protein
MSSARKVMFNIKCDGKKAIKTHLNSKHMWPFKKVAYNWLMGSFMPQKARGGGKGIYNRVNKDLS